MQSPLRWAGSKAWLAGYIKKVYEANTTDARLVEPFAGALNVALAVQPKHVLLNDLNTDLIGFWKAVQAGRFNLPDIDREGYNQRAWSAERYYKNREWFNTERYRSAGAFYILNQTCFNGLWR